MLSESDQHTAEAAYYHTTYAHLLSHIHHRLTQQPPLVWCIKGPKGVGKTWLASWVVQTMHHITHSLDTKGATKSGAQSSFVYLHQEQSMDPGSIRPDDIVLEATPTIDQVRCVLHKLNMTSGPWGYRTIVIRDMHTWNMTCVNAMLQILESPPPRTMFIITTVTSLPATIQSRCYMVTMHPELDEWQPFSPHTQPLDTDQVVKWLSQGCFQRHQYWTNHASWALEAWQMLDSCKTSSMVIPSTAWLKALTDALDSWKEILFVWGHQQYNWAFAHKALLHWDAFWCPLWSVTCQGQHLFVDATTMVCHCLSRVQQFFAYYNRQVSTRGEARESRGAALPRSFPA